ncbi:MAG: AAA family ATPase [Aquificaceae bacterium]|nr:AAA family ATPase [Aquificaceae bacterium]
MIVALIGLPGSGKSFIASILHELGFTWLRTDSIRKELAGIDLNEKAPPEVYSRDWTEKVYEVLIEKAKELSERGQNIVLDGSFSKRWQREKLLNYFKDVIFIHTTAREETIKERLLKRTSDISDADFNIYLKLKQEFEPQEGAIEIFTELEREELRDLLKRVLSL